MDILIINGDNPGDNELWMLWITLGIMWITSKIYPHPNGKTQAIRRFDGFFPGITLWMLRKTQKNASENIYRPLCVPPKTNGVFAGFHGIATHFYAHIYTFCNLALWITSVDNKARKIHTFLT